MCMIFKFQDLWREAEFNLARFHGKSFYLCVETLWWLNKVLQVLAELLGPGKPQGAAPSVDLPGQGHLLASGTMPAGGS